VNELNDQQVVVLRSTGGDRVSVATSVPREHLRYVVRVTGDLIGAPRALLVDHRGNALAIRDDTGSVLWLSVDDSVHVPKSEDGLFPRDTDLVDEARAIVDITELVSFLGDWSNGPVRLAEAPTEDHPDRYRFLDDTAAESEVRLDPETNVVTLLTRTGGTGSTFRVEATRVSAPRTPGNVFSVARLPWDPPA